MLQVIFTQLDDNTIKKFERMEFVDAVAQSATLEKKYRELKKKKNGDFYLIEKDSDGRPLYTGTFVFGSHYAPNLFLHIKKKLEEIKLNKQQQKDRIELIAKMEDGLPDIYKKEEVIENAHLLNLDISKISKLKKWQRRTIYSLTGVLGLFLIGTVFYMVMTIAQYDVAYNKERATVVAQEEKINIYQQGLLGSNEELKKYLQTNTTKLTDEEKRIYTDLLLEEKNFKEVVNLHNNDISHIANVISSQGKVDLLKEFQNDFPTNEGSFDIAYADKKYGELLKLEDVEMTVKRSEMKTYAYMKTGKIEEAKEELNNNNNEEIGNKITEYESLTKQINDVNNKIKEVKDSKKDKKEKEKEIKDLEKKRTELEKKRNEL